MTPKACTLPENLTNWCSSKLIVSKTVLKELKEDRLEENICKSLFMTCPLIQNRFKKPSNALKVKSTT